MHKRLLILSGTIVLAALVATISMFTPLPEEVTHLQLAQTGAIVVLVAGTITLLLLSLRDFRVKLRNAYIVLCIASLLFALSMAQYFVMSILSLYESWWFTSYAYSLPLVLTTVLFYAGNQIIARALAVRSIFLNPLFVLAVAAIAAAIWGASPMFLPSPSLPPEYDKTLSIDAFSMTIYLCAAILVGKVRHVIGRIYKSAFTWVYIWMLAGGINIAVYTTLQVMLPFGNWYYESNLLYLPDVIVSLTALLSGYYLSCLAVTEKDKNAYRKLLSPGADASSTDVIGCLVDFASSKAAIDPDLDQLRLITANHTPNTPFTSEEQSILADLFLKIESYLVTKDPVRRFKGEELRNMIELRFKDSVNEPVFWQKISAKRAS